MLNQRGTANGGAYIGFNLDRRHYAPCESRRHGYTYARAELFTPPVLMAHRQDAVTSALGSGGACALRFVIYLDEETLPRG